MAGGIAGVLAVAGAGLISASAYAQEISVPPPQDDSGVTFSLTPYLWLASVEGTVAATPPPDPGQPIDAAFLDIVPHLTGALMLKSELGFGRWGIVGDISYISLSVDAAPVANPDIISATVDPESLISTVALRYRVIDNPGAQVDVLAGARISYAALGVQIHLPNRDLLGDAEETWVDPVIGVRGRFPLTPHWSAVGYADIGGFGVASDLTEQVYGGFEFDAGEHWDLTAGYRFYKVDYTNLPLRLDLEMSGLMLGATYRF
jgi:hypothetical protein